MVMLSLYGDRVEWNLCGASLTSAHLANKLIKYVVPFRETNERHIVHFLTIIEHRAWSSKESAAKILLESKSSMLWCGMASHVVWGRGQYLSDPNTDRGDSCPYPE